MYGQGDNLVLENEEFLNGVVPISISVERIKRLISSSALEILDFFLAHSLIFKDLLLA